MAISRGPKLVTNGLVLALDASDDNSFAAQNLPIKNGLILWLDAADDDSFVYSSGTEVSQWRDKSGLNNHANQATVANQPSRNTVVNSRKSVNFSSANADRLRVNSGMVFTNSVTAIVFIKPGTQNFAYADILDQDHGMDGYNGWVIQRNNTASQWLVWLANEANTTWLNTNAISYTDNTPQIVTLRKGSSTLTLSSNGTSSGDVAIADQQIRQANYVGLNIGTWRAGNELYATSRHYNGEICEILVYNRALSLTEIKQVHTYLGQKWGIVNTDKSAIDLSGNNNNGLLGNGTTANMPVYDYYNKGALKFDGSNDFIQYPSLLNVGIIFTINFWIKPTSNTRQTIISNGYPYLANKGFFLVCPGNNATDIFLSLGNDQKQVQSNTGAITTGTIQMVTAVVNGVSDLMKLYVNGVEVSYAVQQNADISLQYDSGIFVTGKRDTNSADYLYSNLYALQIYNRALSAAEVLQNYNAQKARFTNTIVQQGLVLNLDAGNNYSYGGSGTTWYDVSGNSFNATLINSPAYTSDNGGVLNWASASSQYATVPMNSTLRVASITEEVWVYLSTTADQVFIGSQYGTGSNNSFALWVSGGTFYFGVNVGGTFYQSASSAPSSGTWYHLVHTYNGTTQYLYINGVQTTSNGAASGNISYDLNNTLLAIAADFNGTGYNVGPTISVNGKMPVVRIYNTALSAAQVLQNYNALKGRFGL